MKDVPEPYFHAFFVRKLNGQLSFQNFRGWETRNESTMKLVELADQRYHLKDFDWIVINTGDADFCKEYYGMKVLSYSTSTEDFELTCPDFNFDNWKQVGVEDYSACCSEIEANGETEPETNMLGWRGAFTHPNRGHLVRLSDKVDIDAEFIEWDRSNPELLTCSNFVSMPGHPSKWRYLIDVEGGGYSGRLKYFMFSRRVVFVADRPYKEWFYQTMKPWEHFVPCRSDMSDLKENLNVIKSDKELENKIRHAALKFARENLTRDACLARWRYLLSKST